MLRPIPLDLAEAATSKADTWSETLPYLQVETYSFSEESGPDEDISALDNSLSMVEERQTVTNCFSTIGLSPFKASFSTHAITAGKRKISDAVSSIKDKVAKTLDVPVDCLSG